jgi:hypothetical protein
MKKLLTEVGNQPMSEADKRIADLEQRLQRLEPKPETIDEPYAIGSQIFSIIDSYASDPMTVVRYDHPTRRIFVTIGGDPVPRPFSLASVVPFERCRLARPREAMTNIADPVARAYWEGRKKAELAGKVTPPLPPPPQQRRWFGAQDQIPTWGISVGTGDER